MILEQLKTDLACWKMDGKSVHEYPALLIATRVAQLFSSDGRPDPHYWPDYRGNGPTMTPAQLFDYLFGR